MLGCQQWNGEPEAGRGSLCRKSEALGDLKGPQCKWTGQCLNHWKLMFADDHSISFSHQHFRSQLNVVEASSFFSIVYPLPSWCALMSWSLHVILSVPTALQIFMIRDQGTLLCGVVCCVWRPSWFSAFRCTRSAPSALLQPCGRHVECWSHAVFAAVRPFAVRRFTRAALWVSLPRCLRCTCSFLFACHFLCCVVHFVTRVSFLGR